jgi:hypothetical protein
MAEQQYQGPYTYVILEQVQSGIRSVSDIVEIKQTFDHMVNDHGMYADPSYETSLNEALNILHPKQK